MAVVNRDSFRDMKKLLKNHLLRNRRSNFVIILQESGFDISKCPDCPIWAVAITGQAAFTICEPVGQVKFLDHYRQFGSLSQIPVSLRPDKQMDIKLFTEFL